MINRREFFGISAAAGATLALTPELLRALQQTQGQLIQRAIPSTGEMLPIISFSPREEADNAAMKEILRTLLDNGGRVVDVMHGGPAGEQAGRTAASELGIQDRLFWTTGGAVNPIPMLPGSGAAPAVEPAAVRAAFEEKLARFRVPMIDLALVGPGGVSTFLPVLREMKKEGLVRYIGVWSLMNPALEAPMRNEEIDFVCTDYSVGDRRVEEKILPLALERKIGFMAYFPFDRGRIFQRASSTSLPEWAAEFDARTWAQFFLKYVVSHPAVTVARVGTTRAAHMLDNIGGGIGRLPDEAMRRRMAAFIDTLPRLPAPAVSPEVQQQWEQRIEALRTPALVLSAAILDRYVGEYLYRAAGTTVTVRRDGDRLLAKVSGNMPEGPLAALSETSFGTAGIVPPRPPGAPPAMASIPWIATIEFQLDGQGKVTGAIVTQGVDGEAIIPLERK